MSFFAELKRRNVFRVAIAYAVASWLMLQIVDLVLENIKAPDWIMQVFMLGLAVGFPIAVIIAWAFELNIFSHCIFPINSAPRFISSFDPKTSFDHCNLSIPFLFANNHAIYEIIRE